MPKIQVMATFTVSYQKTVTQAQLKQLEAGTSIDEIVDESEPFREAATSGDCDMDWEPVTTKTRRKKKSKR